MASLTGTSINSTYGGLLKMDNNAALTGSMYPVTDGAGNQTGIQLSGDANHALNILSDNLTVADKMQVNGFAITGTSMQFAGSLDFASATVTGLPDDNTTYDLTSAQDASNVDIKLTGSDASVDTVKLVAGSNITLTDSGTNQITIAASGGGGGSAPNVVTQNISNMEYGPEWDYYTPGGSTLAGYGQRVIGTCAYLPGGTYDQFHHWVRTAPTAAGSTCNYALYNVDTTSWPVGSALSFKPTTKIVEFTGVDANTTGEKLMNLASPVTLTAGYYFFGFMFNNGEDGTTFQGSYAGWPGTAEANRARSLHSSNGIPTLYQFASSKLPGDLLISGAVGSSTMPSDLSSYSFSGTSFRITWGIVAQ